MADVAAAHAASAPQQSGWDGSYYEVEPYLGSVAHDPDSIDVEDCTMPVDTKEGWVMRCDYRGKNAFGGLIKKSGLFVIKDGRVIDAADL